MIVYWLYIYEYDTVWYAKVSEVRTSRETVKVIVFRLKLIIVILCDSNLYNIV